MTMNAREYLGNQIATADAIIARCKHEISDLDNKIRSQSFDACKYMNSLSGSSLTCHAKNIISFATEMALVCHEMQKAQDWKHDAENKLDYISNG